MCEAVEDCGFDAALLSGADEGVAVAVRPLARAALEVDGMSCASCSGAAERALRALPGVADASVGLLPPRAEVSYDADVTGPRAFVAALEGAGFVARLADRARAGADGARARGVCYGMAMQLTRVHSFLRQRTRRRRPRTAPRSSCRCC